MERSASEKLAHLDTLRRGRDAAVAELASAWGKLDSLSDPASRLLTRESFSPRVYDLLSKGRPFLALSRPIGRSTASGKLRPQYRQKGRAFNAGQADTSDDILAYNESGLNFTTPREQPRRARRVRFL